MQSENFESILTAIEILNKSRSYMGRYLNDEVLKEQSKITGLPVWQLKRLADFGEDLHWDPQSCIEKAIDLSKISAKEFKKIPVDVFRPDSRPSYITPTHWQEWLDSGVKPEIIAANVRSVGGQEAIELICGSASEKVQKQFSYVNEEMKRILARNSNLEDGGWWVDGLDPLAGWERMQEWGQLKPNTPRADVENPEKIIKYVTPEKVGLRAFFLEDPAMPDRWVQAQGDNSPLFLCEGAKKAAALISLGFNAIALPGIFSGRRVPKDASGNPLKDEAHLIPELEVMLTQPRPVVFCFDQDEKESTRERVNQAVYLTGELLKRKGCSVGRCKWDRRSGKGIDDVLVKKGAEFVRNIIEKGIAMATNAAETESRRIAAGDERFASDLILSPQYEVTDDAATPDHHLNKWFFREGKGDYCTMDGAWYHHNGENAWLHVADDDMQKIISEELKKLYVHKRKKEGDVWFDTYPRLFASDRYVGSVFRFNQKNLAVPFRQRGDGTRYLNFKNGVLDIKENKLIPYTRDLYLTSQIQADYTIGDQCPQAWEEFINKAYGPGKKELIRAVIRYYLDSSLPYGYFVHLIGASGSGKGTLIRAIGNILGGSYRAINEFSVLNSAEGRHQYLTGARMVSFPDVTTALGNLGAFYELVDNGMLSGRPLFNPTSFTKQWNARFIMASTAPIQFEKSDGGWDRRCIPVSTIARENIEESDHGLSDRLDACMNQVVSWAMALDKDQCMAILKAPAKFSDDYQRLKDIQAITSDSVKAFIDACLVPSNNSESTPKTTLHGYYKAFCDANNLSAKGFTNFCSRMKSALGEAYEVARQTSREGGRTVNTPAAFIRMELVDNALFSPRSLPSGEQLPLERNEFVCNSLFQSEGGLELFRQFPAKPVSGVSGSQEISDHPETQQFQTFQAFQDVLDPYIREKTFLENEGGTGEGDQNSKNSLSLYRGEKMPETPETLETTVFQDDQGSEVDPETPETLETETSPSPQNGNGSNVHSPITTPEPIEVENFEEF